MLPPGPSAAPTCLHYSPRVKGAFCQHCCRLQAAVLVNPQGEGVATSLMPGSEAVPTVTFPGVLPSPSSLQLACKRQKEVTVVAAVAAASEIDPGKNRWLRKPFCSQRERAKWQLLREKKRQGVMCEEIFLWLVLMGSFWLHRSQRELGSPRLASEGTGLAVGWS